MKIPAEVAWLAGTGGDGLMAVFQREVLPNRLRLLSAPMPQVQSVACFIMLAAGSRYETPRRAGSRTSPSTCSSRARRTGPRRRSSATSSTGSARSSTPSPARSTRATTSSARPSTEGGLSTSSSTCSAIRRSTPRIEREKGVIVEEMNMYFDTPRDYIGGVYHQLLYGDTPLGWDIIGRGDWCGPRPATRSSSTSTAGTRAEDGRRVRGQLRRGDPAGGRGDARRSGVGRPRRGRPASGLERRGTRRPDPLEGRTRRTSRWECRAIR